MIDKIDNASVNKLRKWWLEIPAALSTEDSRRSILDEIAWNLSEKDTEWISFLSEYSYAENLDHRNTAIFFLACKENQSAKLQQILLDAFHSNIAMLQITALNRFIVIDYYPLTKQQIIVLNQSKDQRLAAWGMSYLCYAFPKERIEVLTKALQSKKPRIREYACDVIGEEFIYELKEKMKVLLKDEDNKVLESANYNFYEMLS